MTALNLNNSVGIIKFKRSLSERVRLRLEGLKSLQNSTLERNPEIRESIDRQMDLGGYKTPT